MTRDKKPLYRKENKASLTTKYYVNKGGDFRHARNTKAFLNNEATHMGMKSGRFGYDYTPLFKFLLSKVGNVWDEVFSEAKSRLDKADPIFWMVALSEAKKREIVRLGESTYYWGLYVDDDGLLQIVNPDAQCPDYIPAWFETYSFNGEPQKRISLEHNLSAQGEF